MTEQADGELFVEQLFAGRPAGSLLAVSLAPAWNRPHFVSEPAGVLAYTSGAVDAYVRLTPVSRRPGNGQRGGDELTAALHGVAIDIDINGAPDGRGGTITGAAADLQAATEFAHTLLEPTILVHSGYGLHVYWLLATPFLTDTDEAREQAAALTQGWMDRWVALAREAGMEKLDAVGDLSRVMRVPGSFNGKGSPPAPVELVDDGGPRYEFAQLEQHAAPPRATAAPVVPEKDRVAVLLQRHSDLARLVARKGKKPGKGSASEWDFALGCVAAEHDLGDEDIVALLQHARAKHGEAKGERADYLERTLAKVRQRVGYPTNDQADILAQLTNLLDVGQVGLRIVNAHATGDGVDALVDLWLDDGSVVAFERFGEMSRPDRLAAHLATSLGVWTEFSPLQAKRATGLVRRYAGRARKIGREQNAIDMALDLLAWAGRIPFEFTNTEARYRVWRMIAEADPGQLRPDSPEAYARKVLIAVDVTTGNRFVRASWVQEYARYRGLRQNPTEIAGLLEHVGWHRRGHRGRIKATGPDDTIVLSFYIVDADWIERMEATDD